jgi:hypothetical protein
VSLGDRDRREVDGRGRLADPALEICDDNIHEEAAV